jgi:hypothetical protein
MQCSALQCGTRRSGLGLCLEALELFQKDNQGGDEPTMQAKQ